MTDGNSHEQGENIISASSGGILYSLPTICASHGLILIDWCTCAALSPGDKAFKTYFSPVGKGYRSIARR